MADRFLRHRAAMAGLVLFVLLLAFALPRPGDLDRRAGRRAARPRCRRAPAHPFGTDRIGHDMLASIISGTRYSLQIALVVAAVSTVLGVVLGALAGYLGGWVDQAVSRLIDLILVIPQLVVVAVLARNSFSVVPGQTSSNWLTVALILALTASWLPIARTIRGMVLSLREKEFVEAALASGASTSRIVFRHILPNTIDVIIVNATITIAQAVLLESALSFIGLGVKRPDASLGLIINENKNELVTLPWLFWFPFVFIVLISLSVNFIGDGLRDAFDPRQKRVRVKASRRRSAMTEDVLAAREPAAGAGREPLLTVRDLSVDFPTEDGVVHAVRHVSFDVRAGEVLGIVGESGCGKSVSAQAIMGLLPRTAEVTGSIRFRGRELVGLTEREWQAVRGNDIGMIFQDPMSSLNPVYTVGWQLAEAYRAHHDVSRKAAAARAVEALDLVGIPQPDRRADAVPARVLRRHAAAGDDRDGDHQRPGSDHRRRADHRAGRHRAGADPGDAAAGPATRPARPS